MHPAVILMVLLLFAGVMLLVWSTEEELGTPIVNDATFMGGRSRLLNCIIADKCNGYWRFVVKDGDKERFYKLLASAVTVAIDPDRFFRKNALEVNVVKGKRQFTYYR